MESTIKYTETYGPITFQLHLHFPSDGIINLSLPWLLCSNHSHFLLLDFGGHLDSIFRSACSLYYSLKEFFSPSNWWCQKGSKRRMSLRTTLVSWSLWLYIYLWSCHPQLRQFSLSESSSHSQPPSLSPSSLSFPSSLFSLPLLSISIFSLVD